MESIIKHLVEITGHRDHDLLNISLTSALRELMNAEKARVLEVVAIGDKVLLKPTITITKAAVKIADEDDNHDELVEDIALTPELRDGVAEKKTYVEKRTGQEVLIWLLIWVGDKLQTCIEVVNPANYTENAMEVVNGMLIVYRNFQNLLDYSERDSLTGLLNRKTFEDSFSKVLRNTVLPVKEDLTPPDLERRDTNSEKYHWLAVLDIDHFKRVNDQFGHLYGDEVLILIANILRSSFRPADKLFRFGGEEFVILLRSTTQKDAEHIFERFRLQVAQHDFPQVGQVTISIGYARIDPFEPAVAIVGRADQALYYAKTHGRNRVCYYEALVTSGDLHQEHANDIAEFF